MHLLGLHRYAHEHAVRLKFRDIVNKYYNENIAIAYVYHLQTWIEISKDPITVIH
jgi:hypothetical protein